MAKDDFKYYHIKGKKSFNLEEINANSLKGENYEYYTGPKLLIKHNNIVPETIFIKGNMCFTSSIYSLLHDDIQELKYLCAMLNSALMQFYCIYGINNQKDTTINLNQYMIRHLPIIDISDNLKLELSSKVDKIINNLKNDQGIFKEETRSLIIGIDDIIFNLYSLTEKESQVIILNLKKRISYFNDIYKLN